MKRSPADDPRSDPELVRDINDGDASAFDALYYRYRDWVVRLAGRMTGHSDDALDVLQETFAYVSGKFPGFRLTASFTTFLYPVVRNCSIAARKKRGRFVGNDQALAAVPAAQSGVPSELEAILTGLPEGQRDVLLLRFVDGFSLEEIALALGIPLGTVKSRIHNAIKTLREDPRLRNYFSPP